MPQAQIHKFKNMLNMRQGKDVPHIKELAEFFDANLYECRYFMPNSEESRFEENKTLCLQKFLELDCSVIEEKMKSVHKQASLTASGRELKQRYMNTLVPVINDILKDSSVLKYGIVLGNIFKKINCVIDAINSESSVKLEPLPVDNFFRAVMLGMNGDFDDNVADILEDPQKYINSYFSFKVYAYTMTGVCSVLLLVICGLLYMVRKKK